MVQGIACQGWGSALFPAGASQHHSGILSAYPLNSQAQKPYELLSKLLVSPLITPIVVPYMIPYITPFKEFRGWLISRIVPGMSLHPWQFCVKLVRWHFLLPPTGKPGAITKNKKKKNYKDSPTISAYQFLRYEYVFRL